jgi:ribosomal protein RSM22 (predicted rRNA methylase)
MIGIDLVRPLEDDWRETLDAVARARGWPSSRDVAALGARVAALSEAYNDPGRARAGAEEAGAARLAFSFPRDVPKGAAAVRELIATGALRVPGEGATLSVLDLGAGLGATTWGVARALQAAGARCVLEATWLDADARALAIAEAIAQGRAGRSPVEVRARAVARPLTALDDLGRFDLVLLGQVLSELQVGEPPEARVERHAALLARLLDRHLAPLGSVVVIEPALRERTRHLHRVRDAAVAGGAVVFAPCLHQAPCPALEREGDWCHEDMPVDLPPWLAPVARAAGLRREGLTFSYLVLRATGPRLVERLGDAPGARLRVVSDVIRTKGKREAFLCGALPGLPGARARVTRLDRDEVAGNEAWSDLKRGDVLNVEPAPDPARPRVDARTRIVRAV